MKVVDLALVLSRLDLGDGGEASSVRSLVDTGHTDYTLVTLAPRAQWPAPDADAEALGTGDRTFLALDGVATWVTGDVRQSLASGHLIAVDASTAVRVVNDSPANVVFLRIVAR